MNDEEVIPPNELTDEDWREIFIRTLNVMGAEYEIIDSVIHVGEEIAESDEFLQVMMTETGFYRADKALSSLWERGILEPHGMDESGEMYYRLTELGERALDDYQD